MFSRSAAEDEFPDDQISPEAVVRSREYADSRPEQVGVDRIPPEERVRRADLVVYDPELIVIPIRRFFGIVSPTDVRVRCGMY
jgi:hypothetical protein